MSQIAIASHKKAHSICHPCYMVLEMYGTRFQCPFLVIHDIRNSGELS